MGSPSNSELYRGRYVVVESRQFSRSDGTTSDYEVVRSLGAVGVVAMHQDRVLLVRQFRVPVGEKLLEIPAGLRDVQGESPEDCARRELVEETGFDCESLTPLVSFFAAPGLTDHSLDLFVAQGLKKVSDGPADVEGEEITVEWRRLSDALELITSGEIKDAKTIIGITLAKLRR